MNGIKKGIWPTMITPYDREGRVDLKIVALAAIVVAFMLIGGYAPEKFLPHFTVFVYIAYSSIMLSARTKAVFVSTLQ